MRKRRRRSVALALGFSLISLGPKILPQKVHLHGQVTTLKVKVNLFKKVKSIKICFILEKIKDIDIDK